MTNPGMKHRNVVIFVFWPVDETGTSDLHCFILFSLVILPIPRGLKFPFFWRKPPKSVSILLFFPKKSDKIGGFRGKISNLEGNFGGKDPFLGANRGLLLLLKRGKSRAADGRGRIRPSVSEIPVPLNAEIILYSRSRNGAKKNRRRGGFLKGADRRKFRRDAVRKGARLFISRQVEVAVGADPIAGVDFPVALRADLGVPGFLFHLRAEKEIAPLFGAVETRRLTGGGFTELVADTENAQNRAVGTFSIFGNRNRQFDAAYRTGDGLPRLTGFGREFVTVRTDDLDFFRHNWILGASET